MTILDRLIEGLSRDDRVQAAWLAGSRGRGSDDDLSDIDIWVQIEPVDIADINDDPARFVRQVIPTIMELVAPQNAPDGGTFVSTWTDIEPGVHQIDWYITPHPERAADTRLLFGKAAITTEFRLVQLSHDDVDAAINDNFRLALMMLGNACKWAQRGDMWGATRHLEHANNCLAVADFVSNHRHRPAYADAKRSFLPGQVPSTRTAFRDAARYLLEQLRLLAAELSRAELVMRPADAIATTIDAIPLSDATEYFRNLPRRRMGAGLLITDADDRILLLETTYKSDWEIPGGTVEAGESPRVGATREVVEEVGLPILPGPMLVFVHRPEADAFGDGIVIVFDGGTINSLDQLTLQPSEIRQAHLVADEELDQVVNPRMAARLRAALRARELGRLIEIDNGQVIYGEVSS